MCEHSMAFRSERMEYPGKVIPDHTAVERTYDRYGAMLYGMLLKVVFCEHCANEIMVRTCTEHITTDEVRELAGLLGAAFGNVTRLCESDQVEVYRSRIRELCAHALGTSPERKALQSLQT